MATIYDMIEVTGIAADTTYSETNGNLLGVVDGSNGTSLNDGEFDEGDSFIIEGLTYTIDRIQEPSSSGRFTLGDGSDRSFNPQSESNLDVVFLTVSRGGVTRYFVIPNDSYGDMNVQAIRTGSIEDVAGNDAALVSTQNNSVDVVCFAAGTLIETTDRSQRTIEDLRQGDPVRTLDHGFQAVKWIGRRTLSRSCLAHNPQARPIRIRRGALGTDVPQYDLLVSPQHRMFVRSAIAARMFDHAEVLVPAKSLLALDGVEIAADLECVTYYHLLFDRHEVVFANGSAAESLYTGPQALKVLAPADRIEVLSLFPEVSDATIPPSPPELSHPSSAPASSLSGISRTTAPWRTRFMPSALGCLRCGMQPPV